MYQLKSFERKGTEIASYLKLPFIGPDIVVNNVQQLNRVIDNSLSLCYPKYKEALSGIKHTSLIFCTEDTVVDNPYLSFIITSNPKLSFFKYVFDQLVSETSYWCEVVSSSSEKYQDVLFGYHVKIGTHVVIAPGVRIGNGCVIGNNVVIRSNTLIGNSCTIKDNTVIGSEGFGFMNSEEGILHIPQIGSIEIGNDVMIGSNSTVEKPSLGATIIEDSVKIDDLVQIGHNQWIGRNTIITTGFKAEGNVKIGSDTFIGMGVTIVSKKVSVGNNCLIGAGTVLSKSVPDNTMVYCKQDLVFKPVKNRITDILSTKKI